MSEPTVSMPAERLASLGRAAVETGRYDAAEHGDLTQVVSEALSALDDKRRGALLPDVASLLGTAEKRDEPAVQTLGVESSKGAVQGLMQQRASLDLKLKSEAARREEVEAALQQERDDHKQAIESLSLQQKQIKELTDERSRLLKDIAQLEAKLRVQINETEQAALRYDKLKTSRQTMGDQATELTEKINELEAANLELRKQAEAAKHERDLHVADAQSDVSAAEEQTANAAFGRLWRRMNERLPDVFVETHVPTENTMEQVCDALVEFAGTFAVLEGHVQYMLQQLRQVGEEGDKLNHFYLMLKRNPALLEILRKALVAGKRSSQFKNVLRLVQAWVRAFATGTYKVIIVAPDKVRNELNYRNWEFKRAKFESEEAALGKYFKEIARAQIPDELGNQFKKLAADMAYEDYNTLMKRR